MQSDTDKLVKNNPDLNHLEFARVVSHVQRDQDDWVINTLMLEGYDVPFKYSRKKTYRSLEGSRVNLTYYAQLEEVAGLEFEVMKVVRVRRS